MRMSFELIRLSNAVLLIAEEVADNYYQCDLEWRVFSDRLRGSDNDCAQSPVRNRFMHDLVRSFASRRLDVPHLA